MFYINDKAFSYLLYPKKYDTEDNKVEFKNNVEMLYYYLNRGVPTKDMATPVYCTQEMVNQYGLDNLVMNLQRKFKYDFDIIVVKVPQEYLRMEPMIRPYSVVNEKFDEAPKMMPIECVYEFNGEKQPMISSDYIESIYLRYPDCRRIINDNWKLVSPDAMGMVNSEFQNDMLLAYGNYGQYSAQLDKYKFMNETDVDTRELKEYIESDEEEKEKFASDSESVIDFIEKKYFDADKVYTCKMSQLRIENLLRVEEVRQAKKERVAFIGE